MPAPRKKRRGHLFSHPLPALLITPDGITNPEIPAGRCEVRNTALVWNVWETHKQTRPNRLRHWRRKAGAFKRAVPAYGQIGQVRTSATVRTGGRGFHSCPLPVPRSGIPDGTRTVHIPFGWCLSRRKTRKYGSGHRICLLQHGAARRKRKAPSGPGQRRRRVGAGSDGQAMQMRAGRTPDGWQ